MNSAPLLLDCTAFHPSCSAGGVSIYMQEILPRLGENLQFHAYYKHLEPGILDSCRPNVVSDERVCGDMITWRDRAVRKLRSTGAKGVWYPTQFSAWLPILPSVATIHDMAAFLAWRSFGAVAKAYMPATLVATCRNAKSIIVISESSAADLNRIFPWTKKKTIIARHGLPSDVRLAAGVLGIRNHPDSGPYQMIFLDGANQRKRLDLCLRVLEKRRWHNVELKITGNPGKVSERIIRTLGHVPKEISLVGRLERSELLSTLAHSDLLLYPSDFEGFGFPLVESMAFGTSVVSFPGNAEREVGGDHAVFTDRPDEAALSVAIDTTLERVRDVSWQDAISRHALDFTWKDSVEIHQKTLEYLL
jgi:glycosyltransferase involved in cell wall biosynthesis